MIRRKMIMDNIFEYLIYGFIIISFISSFFKKKKPLPKVPPDQITHQRTDITENKIIDIPPSQVRKADEYDILKEIEGFFNVGQQKQSESKVHTDEEIYEGVKNREKFIPVPEKSFHTTTSSEHTFYNSSDIKRIEQKKKKELSSIKEKQASVYDESLIKKDSASVEIIRNINRRLKNPSTLKEYVIISEIIGKPKALKR